MFRLVIDIPLNDDQEDSTTKAQEVIEQLKELAKTNVNLGLTRYRLAKDEDRRPKNYLDKDENGHVSGKKAWLVPENKTEETN
jgi:hypothetical protein